SSHHWLCSFVNVHARFEISGNLIIFNRASSFFREEYPVISVAQYSVVAKYGISVLYKHPRSFVLKKLIVFIGSSSPVVYVQSAFLVLIGSVSAEHGKRSAGHRDSTPPICE